MNSRNAVKLSVYYGLWRGYFSLFFNCKHTPTIDCEDAQDDTLTLEHNESDWSQTIQVADLVEIEPDWVELFFTPPKKGTFNFYLDENDGEELNYIFVDISYEDLGNLSPAADVDEDEISEDEQQADSAVQEK